MVIPAIIIVPPKGDVEASMRWKLQLGFTALLGMLGGGASAQEPHELFIGQMVAEQLADGDLATPPGGVSDLCQFIGEEGQRIVVSLRSDDFDAHLRVTSPGGQAVVNNDAELGSTHARIEMTLLENGRHTITVSSRDPAARGLYRLSVVLAEDAEETGSLSLGAIPGGSQASGAPITLGQTVNSALGEGDPLSVEGRFEDLYLFDGAVGQRVAVEMASRFDTLLHVTTPRGDTITDDNSGAGTNSRIVLTVDEAGTHRVVATSAALGVSGPYGIRVLSASGPASASQHPRRQGYADGGPISPGESIRGQINTQDDQLPSGERMDVYTLHGEEGQVIEVAMESSAFDTYLVLMSPSGRQFDNDDERAMGTNSRLVMSLFETGQWGIIATTYMPEEFGDYTLALRLTDSPPNSQGGTLAIGEVVEGQLTDGDLRDSSGAWCDEYSLEVETGQNLRLRMTSPGTMDTYLIYLDPSGFQMENDDLGNTTDSGLDVTVQASGTALIGASMYGFGPFAPRGGRYTLTVNETGGEVDDEAPETLSLGGESRLIVLGQTATGQLSAGDHISTGRYVEGFRFRGQANQTVDIVMASSDFSPSVHLRLSDGQILAGESGDGESCLNVQLPVTTRYTIMCTSEGRRESGRYTLSLN